MAASPQIDSDGPVKVTIESNGATVSDEVRLFSVRVRRAAGTIPTARLIVDDGDMASQDWPVANDKTFAPGAEITIKAGYAESQETIFSGLVVKLGVKIGADNFSRLIIDCQDKATKLTTTRKNANYIDQTDSQIIQKIVGAYGLPVDVESTSITYGELVQYYCSDWDFIMSRAEVNGLLIIAEDGTLKVKKPDVSREAALSVSYGQDLMEFQAEIDARSQLPSVDAVAWDPKTQTVVLANEAPTVLNEQGNLDAATLGKVVGPDTYTLQSATTLEQSALKAWAAARQLKAALARIRGRMKFQGSALAKVGSTIDISGVGERYNGAVFVTGLEHEIGSGNWFTEVEFGSPAAWFAERPDIVAPAAAGWLPGAEGLQVGVVKKLDGDPKGEQRVQVTLPVLQAESDGIWARLMQYYASNAFGAFYVPEVGDEVVLGYFNNDPSNPVILGSLYSSNRAPPYPLTAENDIKALVTRSKTKIEINDADKIVTIETPAHNKVVIDDKNKSILLSDQNGNTLELSPNGISLDSPTDIKLTAKGSISLDAVGPVSVTSKADVTVKGLNVTAQAQVALTAKGSATAELSASGVTTVKGAMVMIN